MVTKPLYAITALFDTVDKIIDASSAVSGAGYQHFDVHTPYPVHGLDGAMRLKPSKVGYLALGFGLLGAFSVVAFITWVTAINYPLVIGGKPFWSWPAYVPVSFEVTVLMASVLSTVAMIALLFKLPNNSHPLHGTAYMRSVSSDRFGISIEARDPRFDEGKVTELLKKVGGKDVTAVYFEPVFRPATVFEPRFLALLALTAVVSSGVTYFSFNKMMYIVPFDWMSVQAKQKSQNPSDIFADGMGMRRPVPGTVARGYLPYPYAGKPEEAAKNLVNPLLPSTAVIDRGRMKFLTYCSPCHGNFGRGDSRLQGQFPNPPTLHSDKVRNWPDGAIYNVITQGQNAMPSYAAQISRDDRWAIIDYIRVLQRAQNAKESDLK